MSEAEVKHKRGHDYGVGWCGGKQETERRRLRLERERQRPISWNRFYDEITRKPAFFRWLERLRRDEQIARSHSRKRIRKKYAKRIRVE